MNAKSLTIRQLIDFNPKNDREKEIYNINQDELDNFPHVYFLQIKEKFGTLRLYASYEAKYHEQVTPIINQYESLSRFVCERCGYVGENVTTEGSWLKTYCKRCRRDVNNEKDMRE